ncbi:MAG: hypothetical protein V1907_00700, partial [Candidatus Kerfeldbacteria bacterium]
MGWKNADRATAVSLGPSADVGQFSGKNSAHIVSSDLTSSSGSNALSSPDQSLICDAWSVLGQSPGAGSTFENVTVSASFAGKGPSDGTDIAMAQYSIDGTTWQTGTTFLLRDTVSNSRNEGYTAFPIQNVSAAELGRLQVKFVVDVVPSKARSELWIDGVVVHGDVRAKKAGTQSRFQASTCRGWSNADAARVISESSSAGFDAVKQSNAAVISAQQGGTSGMITLQDTGITCDNFSFLKAIARSTIVGQRLVVSLAGRGSIGDGSTVVPSYSVDGGQTWISLAPILIDGEVSNGRNGGYRQYDLPSTVTREQLAAMAVRFTLANGDTDATTFIKLDGVELELDLVKSKDRSSFGPLSFLARHSFLPIEDPVIFIDTDTVRNVEITDINGKRVDIPYAIDRSGKDDRSKVVLKHGTYLRPGTYVVTITSKIGFTTIKDVQKFSWGIVTVNSPQVAYARGQQVPVTIGIVDANGATVCNADITARITAPDGKVLTARTKDGTIAGSKTCGPESVTADPDYFFRILGDQDGQYRINVETQTDQGPQSSDLAISVGGSRPFAIERVGPSRVNPKQPYLIHLFVTATDNYKGTVTEIVPRDMIVSSISQKGQLAEVDEMNSSIQWDVDWKKGKEYELTYVVDPPDVSPAIFALGPTTIGAFAAANTMNVASDKVIERENPNVKYAPVAINPDRWGETQKELIETKQAVFRSDQQAVVDLWSDGFRMTGNVPKGLKADKPLKVVSVTLKGPSGNADGVSKVTEIVDREGRERKTLYFVPDKGFEPGTYVAEATLSDGKATATRTVSFEWGTFSIATSKESYSDNVPFGLSFLIADLFGTSVCKGETSVELTTPSGEKVTLNTQDGTLAPPLRCDDQNSAPLYRTMYTPTQLGAYDVTVTSTIDGEKRSAKKTISVVEKRATPPDIAKMMQDAVSIPDKRIFKSTEAPKIDVEVGKSGETAATRTVDAIQLRDARGRKTIVNVTPTERTEGMTTLASYAIDNAYLTSPGLYKATVYVSQGEYTEPIEQDFTWGVLSVNVRRSYERTNTATEIGMSVLDDIGKTQCDATVKLDVTGPDGQIQHFATADSSIRIDPECVDRGITNNPDYAATYTTKGQGTYTMTVTATIPNGTRSITDTFEVKDDVLFDVERIAFPSRVFPETPYAVQFTIKANQDYQGAVVETTPTSFGISNVSDNGTVSQLDTFHGRIVWNVDWKAGETHTLGYTIDFPKVAPEFYVLGPLTIGEFREARQWQIASDALTGTGMLAYDEDGAVDTTPHYRTWDGSQFSAEGQLQNDEDANDDTNHTIIESAPTRNEYIVGRLIQLGELDIQVYDGPTASWINGTGAPANGDFSTDIGTTNDIYRGFDIAYEASTGDAIVVYESSSGGDGLLKYRTWDGSSWSAEADIDYTGVDEATPAPASWVECEADHDTDNILCGWQEASQYGVYGARWDGSAWQNIARLTDVGQNGPYKNFDLAWEGSGQGMILYGLEASPYVDASTYDAGTGWTDTTPSGPGTATNSHFSIAGAPNHDYIAMSYIEDISVNSSDYGVDMWDGADWISASGATENSDTNTFPFAQGTDVAWERGGSDRALFVYRNSSLSTTGMMYFIYDISVDQYQVIDNNVDCLLTEGGAGTIEQVTALANAEDSGGPCLGNTWADLPNGWKLEPAPSSGKIMVIAEDTTADIVPEAILWNGDANGTWSTPTASSFEADLSTGVTISASLPTRAYDFAFRDSYEANVHVTGTQSNLSIPSSTQHVGGAFTINQSRTSENITSIMITENGTVNGQTNLDNIFLRYEPDTSAPYNCASETYAGTETQYGSTTDTDGFSGANGTSTFTAAGIAVTPISTLCVYVILDVLAGAGEGETIEIEIANPSTDVVVSAGGIGPTFARLLPGTTTLSIPFIVGGTCKKFDQSADCDGDDGSDAITIAFGTTIQGSTDATVDGSWSISGLTAPDSGTVVTVFINGASPASERAVAITKYDGSGSIDGIQLIWEHLTIGSSDTGATLTSSELGTCDNDAGDCSGDADVFHNYNGSTTFTVDSTSFSTQEELYIQLGWTYRPDSGGGDTLITHDLENLGTLNMDGNGLTVGGSYVNSGTFTKSAGQTTTFTSTASGEIVTPGTGNLAKVEFNGSGGDWTPSAAVNIDETLTMTTGQLKGTQNVTVVQDVIGTAGTINLTGGTFKQEVAGTEPFGPTTSNTDWIFNNLTFARSSGTAIIDTNSCSDCDVTVTGVLAISESGDGAGTTLLAGDKTWTLTNPASANPFDNDGQATDAGTLTAETSTFDYAGDVDGAGGSAVVIENVTYNNLNLTSDGVAEEFDAAGTSAVSSTLTTNANATLIGTDDWSLAGVTSNGVIILTGGTATFTATGVINGSGTRTFYAMATSGTGTTTVSAATNAGNNVSVAASTTL